MRAIFIAGGKLLGLLMFYWAINVIPQFGFWVSMREDWVADGIAAGWLPGAMALQLLVTIGFGWILVFRTERLADLFKIRETEKGELRPEVGELLRVGIIVIGVYLLATAIPKLAERVIEVFRYGAGLWEFHFSRLIEILLQILLGLWLALSSRRVAGLIANWEKQ